MREENYIEKELVGKGSFAHVYKAKEVSSDAYGRRMERIVALKYLDIRSDESVMNEAHVLMQNKCPYVVNCSGVMKSTNNKFIIMVLEYCENMNLAEHFDYYKKNQTRAANIFLQTFVALDYLHKLGWIHRDIKPENILVDKDMNIKLADFGIVRSVRDSMAQTQIGSPLYMAPEVHASENYSFPVDIWSTCATFYRLFKGCAPFDLDGCTSLMKLYQQKIDTKFYIPLTEKICNYAVVREIINEVLLRKHDERPTAEQIVARLRKAGVTEGNSELERTVFGKGTDSKNAGRGWTPAEESGVRIDDGDSMLSRPNYVSKYSTNPKQDSPYKLNPVPGASRIINEREVQETQLINQYTSSNPNRVSAPNMLENTSVYNNKAICDNASYLTDSYLNQNTPASSPDSKKNPYTNQFKSSQHNASSSPNKKSVKVVTSDDEDEGQIIGKLERSDQSLEEDPDHWEEEKNKIHLPVQKKTKEPENKKNDFFDDYDFDQHKSGNLKPTVSQPHKISAQQHNPYGHSGAHPTPTPSIQTKPTIIKQGSSTATGDRTPRNQETEKSLKSPTKPLLKIHNSDATHSVPKESQIITSKNSQLSQSNPFDSKGSNSKYNEIQGSDKKNVLVSQNDYPGNSKYVQRGGSDYDGRGQQLQPESPYNDAGCMMFDSQQTGGGFAQQRLGEADQRKGADVKQGNGLKNNFFTSNTVESNVFNSLSYSTSIAPKATTNMKNTTEGIKIAAQGTTSKNTMPKVNSPVKEQFDFEDDFYDELNPKKQPTSLPQPTSVLNPASKTLSAPVNNTKVKAAQDDFADDFDEFVGSFNEDDYLDEKERMWASGNGKVSKEPTPKHPAAKPIQSYYGANAQPQIQQKQEQSSSRRVAGKNKQAKEPFVPDFEDDFDF